MIYNNEKEFVDELEKKLNELNYKTWREVIPDECKDWEQPLRVDLIFWHPVHKFIAIEAKNTHSLRQGGKFSQAIKQIINYKDSTFLKGQKISLWCVAVPQSIETLCGGVDKERILREVNDFISTFIKNMYKISLLKISSYGITIDAGTRDRINIKKIDNQIPPVNYTEYKLCPKCEYENDIEDKICDRCGATLDTE